MKRVSLLSCFTPPDDFHGDFGWVCGFTAHPDILEEIANRFTHGARRRRASLAVFLHPADRHIPMRRGILVPFLRPELPMPFQLLHAKVALLHFNGKAGSLLRLVVSTGNWTHDPLETSIDLFWIVEWRQDQEVDRQVVADILAAAEMFEWLRNLFDSSVLELEIGGSRAEDGLRQAVGLLPKTKLPPPRFLDTRRQALQPQILKYLARKGSVKRSRLIMGSGYFEAGDDADVGVLQTFLRALIEERLATRNCEVDVILNANSCQGLAAQKEALVDSGWKLRPPYVAHLPGAKLHAKFLFGAGGGAVCRNPWCYIGSGNLSRIGFTRAVGSGGNLEAGVVFMPEGYLTWKGYDEYCLAARLPVDLDAIVDPENLKQGDPYEMLGPAAKVPPVSYLRWCDGKLSLPDPSIAFPDLTVRLPGRLDGALPMDVAEAPASALLLPMLAEVPVLTDQGFVLPPLGPKRVEDVLLELLFFPQLPPEERDAEYGGDVVGEEDTVTPLAETSDYPSRRMMRLIVRMTECQAKIERLDWERWVNRVDDLLNALAVPEEETIAAFRSYDIEPVGALLHPIFLPKDLLPAEIVRLKEVVDGVRVRWGLAGREPLLPAEARL
jgi:hypothetical protein